MKRMIGMIAMACGGHPLFINPRYIVECGTYPDGRGGCWIRVEGQPLGSGPTSYHYHGSIDELALAVECAVRGEGERS